MADEGEGVLPALPAWCCRAEQSPAGGEKSSSGSQRFSLSAKCSSDTPDPRLPQPCPTPAHKGTVGAVWGSQLSLNVKPHRTTQQPLTLFLYERRSCTDQPQQFLALPIPSSFTRLRQPGSCLLLHLIPTCAQVPTSPLRLSHWSITPSCSVVAMLGSGTEAQPQYITPEACDY